MAAEAIEHASKFELSSWNWTNFNATQYVPSAKDLALAGPRMFMKLGKVFSVPEAVDSIFGVRLGQRMIPEATGGAAAVVDAVTTAAMQAGGAGAGGVRGAIQAGTQILVDVDEQTATGFSSRFTMEGIRSLGNVFTYATSKWALGCIVVAIILNRTYVYASTRRNLVLPWRVRFILRITPIVLLLLHARSLLQSIQCQTSPDFGMLRWGNASKTSELLFTQNGGFLHELSSTLLFGASDEDSCVAVSMIPPEYDEELAKLQPDGKMPKTNLKGSLSLLWPLFQTFSYSQFIETISCAVQGRQVAAETGMTLFEHSLAFAEAEAAIGNNIGFTGFGSTKMAKMTANSTAEATEIAITRSMIMGKVNTTPEVLLVGFLSTMNHVTSHILAVFNLQGRGRLINTGFWGLSFMAAIVMSIWTFSIDDLPNQSLLRFPTVCIVGFIPHMLVLCGIIACATIYGAALTLSALSPPEIEEIGGEDREQGPLAHNTFWRRFVAAHRNMQANVPLSSIRITLHMDFYTALLKTGFSVMTIASEAVYLNESRQVSIKQRTWLEEERLREIEDVGAQWLGPTFKLHDSDSGLADSVGLVASTDAPMELLQKSSSGYAKEMTAKKAAKMPKARNGMGLAGGTGVGATERSGRWIMAIEFFLGIARLSLSWWASLLLRAIAGAGFESRPRVLVWLARSPKRDEKDNAAPVKDATESLDFWNLNIPGKFALPKHDGVDVEVEMRAQLRKNAMGQVDENKLDSSLYDWWLGGGFWGAVDKSGDFDPDQQELDEDTTSVISFATTNNDQEEDWESDEGSKTPTQRSPAFSRESTPFLDTPLTGADLAQLLHPKTPEQRAEAQALSAHLSSNQIITRSRYNNLIQRERAAVLTSTLHRPTNFVASSPTGKLTQEEESQILEYLIISRRNFQSQTSSSSSSSSKPGNSKGGAGEGKSWATGASGMGEGGPQCVVCQSSPRSIIVWPCRCLSLCDDCRVTLAMNNFDKCVCCRRDVASFSRIFVP